MPTQNNTDVLPPQNYNQTMSAVTGGALINVGNNSNIFTSPLLPGVALFRIKRFADIAKGQGCVAFHGGTPSSPYRCSFSVNASDPLSTLSDIMTTNAKVMGFSVRPSLASSRTSPGNRAGVRSTFSANLAYIQAYDTYTVVGSDTVETAETVHFVMGVLTGATQGLGLSYVWPYDSQNSFWPLAAGSAGIAANFGGWRGHLSTGVTRPVVELYDAQRDIVFDGMSDGLRSKAEGVLDVFLADDWWVSNAKYLVGVTMSFTTKYVQHASSQPWSHEATGGILSIDEMWREPQDLDMRNNALTGIVTKPNSNIQGIGPWDANDEFNARPGTPATAPRRHFTVHSPVVLHKEKQPLVLAGSHPDIDAEVFAKAITLADTGFSLGTVVSEADAETPFNVAFGRASERLNGIEPGASPTASAANELDEAMSTLLIDRNILRAEWDRYSRNNVCPELQYSNLVAATTDLYRQIRAAIG